MLSVFLPPPETSIPNRPTKKPMSLVRSTAFLRSSAGSTSGTDNGGITIGGTVTTSADGHDNDANGNTSKARRASARSAARSKHLETVGDVAQLASRKMPVMAGGLSSSFLSHRHQPVVGRSC